MYLTLFYVKKGTAEDNDSTSVNTCSTAENGKKAHSAETGSSGDQKLEPGSPIFLYSMTICQPKATALAQNDHIERQQRSTQRRSNTASSTGRTKIPPLSLKVCTDPLTFKTSLTIWDVSRREAKQRAETGFSPQQQTVTLHSNQAEASAGGAQFISR